LRSANLFTATVSVAQQRRTSGAENIAMANNETALEIAERVNEMRQENRVLRSILVRYWNHAETWDSFFQTGIQQLQAREKEDQESERLQKRFPASSDDNALWKSPREEVVSRMDV
jgi:hypothetical protein